MILESCDRVFPLSSFFLRIGHYGPGSEPPEFVIVTVPVNAVDVVGFSWDGPLLSFHSVTYCRVCDCRYQGRHVGRMWHLPVR